MSIPMDDVKIDEVEPKSEPGPPTVMRIVGGALFFALAWTVVVWAWISEFHRGL